MVADAPTAASLALASPLSLIAERIRCEEGQFMFDLDAETVARIQEAIAQQETLLLSRERIAQLRQSAIWDDRDRQFLQSGLTFCTCYPVQRRSQATPGCPPTAAGLPRTIVLRTVVSLDGDILNQVRSDYLAHPDCRAIAGAHYWLVAQLTDQLDISLSQYLESRVGRLLRLLPWTPVVYSILHQGQQFTLESFGTWASQAFLELGLAWVLQVGLQWLITSLLSLTGRLALRYALSPSPALRKIANQLLGRFIP